VIVDDAVEYLQFVEQHVRFRVSQIYVQTTTPITDRRNWENVDARQSGRVYGGALPPHSNGDSGVSPREMFENTSVQATLCNLVQFYDTRSSKA